jgi:hypothetical protein
MSAHAYAVLAGGWFIWLTPFLLARRTREPAGQLDRRAQWGILLEGVAYSMLWQNNVWERSRFLGSFIVDARPLIVSIRKAGETAASPCSRPYSLKIHITLSVSEGKVSAATPSPR